MKVDAETESTIRGMLDEYAEAVGRGDAEKMRSMFAPDTEVVHMGTGLGEWCNALANLRFQFVQNFVQCDALKLKFKDMHILGNRDVCWAAANIEVTVNIDESDKVFKGRATAVFEKIGGWWYFVQSHMSLPAVGQEEMTGFPEEGPEGFVDAA